MRKGYILIIAVLIYAGVQAENDSNFFWITFKDKKGTPFSVSRPQEFLSTKAMARRAKSKVNITIDDLPVNPIYVQGISMEGAHILYASKWLNAVAVLVPPGFETNTFKKLPFVSDVKPLGPKTEGKESEDGDFMEYLMKMLDGKSKEAKKANDGYGQGFTQIDMLNGIELHKDGFNGAGITIAVLDAGFRKVNELDAFKKLIVEERVLGIYDFVDNDTLVYDSDLHGLNVLSCMAADDKNKMTGTAPGASYYLFRTENAATEFPIETTNWIRAAEVADSIGVDIINSSLGYTKFDDSTLNFTYRDMNGKTTLISKAASMAAERGILICNAAGNEGDGAWRYIGAPADAIGIIAVGGVNAERKRAGFSSIGPTADGRQKPEVSAMGEGTIVASSLGGYYASNGTSFASPVLCGLAACLWQTDISKSASQIIDAIYQSATKFSNPDNLLGYGLPDFEMARMYLGTSKTFDYTQNQWVRNVTLNKDGEIVVDFYAAESGNLKFVVLDKKAKKLISKNDGVKEGQFISWAIGKVKDAENLEIVATLNGKKFNQKINLKR